MPSWNIHLSVANDINKKLKLDKNSFYLGNTLPDVDYSMNITRKDTHFYNSVIKCITVYISSLVRTEKLLFHNYTFSLFVSLKLFYEVFNFIFDNVGKLSHTHDLVLCLLAAADGNSSVLLLVCAHDYHIGNL